MQSLTRDQDTKRRQKVQRLPDSLEEASLWLGWDRACFLPLLGGLGLAGRPCSGARSEILTSTGRFPITTIALPLPSAMDFTCRLTAYVSMHTLRDGHSLTPHHGDTNSIINCLRCTTLVDDLILFSNAGTIRQSGCLIYG